VADELEREDERQRSKEHLERQFDALKHLSTLNAAITVVVLTIYQVGGLSGAAVGLSLMFFGLSLVGALVGMYHAMIALRVGSTSGVVPWGVLWSGGTFFGGLVGFAYFILAGA
jgi:hypothetical protein